MPIFQMPARTREEEIPEGEILAGKSRVTRVIGAGAMGIVVQVVALAREGVFALKLLRPSVARDPIAAQRFLREAEVAGRIENPHVVKISDVGELARGMPYLVMEYLVGLDDRRMKVRSGRATRAGDDRRRAGRQCRAERHEAGAALVEHDRELDS